MRIVVFDVEVCCHFIELLDMIEVSSAESAFFCSSKAELDLNLLEPESKPLRREEEEEEVAEEMGQKGPTTAEGVSGSGTVIGIVVI